MLGRGGGNHPPPPPKKKKVCGRGRVKKKHVRQGSRNFLPKIREFVILLNNTNLKSVLKPQPILFDIVMTEPCMNDAEGYPLFAIGPFEKLYHVSSCLPPLPTSPQFVNVLSQRAVGMLATY